MKSHKSLYPKIYSLKNLTLAWQRARKGKTKKQYVKKFEKNIAYNLKILHDELRDQTYKPEPLKTFILRDPKTRKISKSDFRDRIVHHALFGVLEPLFDKTFIHDSCANRKGRGNLFAISRFRKFSQKVSRNGKIKGWFTNNQIKSYCLKADIKHYFQEVDHKILLNIIKRKVADKKVIQVIRIILKNNVLDNPYGKGMPLGNLTSQFFANIYLNELDQFVKHQLRAKYYIRYVDDFVLLDSSRKQLLIRGGAIENFLSEHLKLELHPQKYKIISLSKGVDFVGFRNFYYFKLIKRRNVRKIFKRIEDFGKGHISYKKMMESFNGWNAYAKWGNALKLRRKVLKRIYAIKKKSK
ncbi:MAG: reverse transcriptase/maturase family protein [Nanoarchaeota archaeon]|nr:reverse transcriptase/maturase family protein [Nanoarchaeota archaeon]